MIPFIDVFAQPVPNARDQGLPELEYKMVHGVMVVTAKKVSSDIANGNGDKNGPQSLASTQSENLFPIGTFEEFVEDFAFIRSTIFHGPTITYAYTRLELLSARFNLHVLLNGTRELDAQKSVPHRDFYNVRKVDTHVHHSGKTLATHPIQHTLSNYIATHLFKTSCRHILS